MKLNTNSPNYKKLYFDLIQKNYPEKFDQFLPYFQKEKLTNLDVITISNKLNKYSGNTNFEFNQKIRAYDTSTIKDILEYKKKFKLNKSQLAEHFSLSRNTVSQWIKKYNF